MSLSLSPLNFHFILFLITTYRRSEVQFFWLFMARQMKWMANKGLTGSNSLYIQKKKLERTNVKRKEKFIYLYTHTKQRYEIRYSRHKFLMDSREEEKKNFLYAYKFAPYPWGRVFLVYILFAFVFLFSFFFFLFLQLLFNFFCFTQFFSCPLCRSVQTDERSKQSFSQKRAIFQQNKYDENEVRNKTKRHTLEWKS